MPRLRDLALASCPGLTDAALAALPPGVTRLELVCCERITGAAVVWVAGCCHAVVGDRYRLRGGWEAAIT